MWIYRNENLKNDQIVTFSDVATSTFAHDLE